MNVTIAGRRLILIAGGGTAIVLLALGLLLVNFIAGAARVNVTGQTTATAASAAQAVAQEIRSDTDLAQTVSTAEGIAPALANRVDETTGTVLVDTLLDLLRANPRVTAFYFFNNHSGYAFGQSVDPASHIPSPVEQPPDWFGGENRMQATLSGILGRHGPGRAMLLTFGPIGDPYGSLQIYQAIVAADGHTVLGAMIEQVTGASIFAPYLHPSGDSGTLFLAGSVVIGPHMARDQATALLSVTASDPGADISITGGLSEVPIGYSLHGAHPSFILDGAAVVGSTAAVEGIAINDSSLRAISYAGAVTISDAAQRVLFVVTAFVVLLVTAVCGLIINLNRRLEQGERENARRIQAKNEALVAANAQLEVLASTDPLTDLPNRALLRDRLGQALRDFGRVALLLLDLDRFKEINDTLGHHYGDLLLQQASVRLREVLDGSATIARLGGDEFAVLLPGADSDSADDMARQLLASLETPMQVDGQLLDVDASIGIALYPNHGLDAATLLRCADVAMYVAKRSNSGVATYSIDTDQHSPRRLTLMSELRQAIARDALLLYYQPMVSVTTGKVRGVEALIRWDHPDHGFIAPEYFIPLAEYSGLIEPLTEWVLDKALRQCQTWQQADLPLTISVNLSMRSLHDSSFPATMEGLLRRYSVSPERLTLEITESALMADPMRAPEVVRRLGAGGVRVAIDDFGTGYSSLGYLKRLPVQQIKLDKSFVLGLGTTSDLMDAAIVRSVISMARALDREVVAEGVERIDGWRILRSMGCDLAQGHYLGRPMPVADLEQWVVGLPWGLQPIVG